MNSFIKGNVKKIIYSGETGYMVGLFKIHDSSMDYSNYIGDTVSFTGYFHDLNLDDLYIMYGHIVEHAKYGEQFSVELYERCMPEEKDSIVSFLCSGLFKGIGEKTATKIVDILGKDSLKIILDNPSNLLLIPGITKKQMDILHNTLVQYEGSYSTILKLNEIGFMTKDSMQIYNKYKDKTIELIDKDIYLITRDVRDINFKKLDAIALKLSYSYDDIRRVKASILFVMDELCNFFGHSYLSVNEIYEYLVKILTINVKEEIFIDAINNLIMELLVVKSDDKYYLKQMWDAEDNIVKRVKYLVNKDDIVQFKIDMFIDALQKDMSITYNDDQLLAIKSSVLKNFLIITGGPGTGKTTIIKSIVDLYKNINKLSYGSLTKELVLLAPTGRAAKRLSEQAVFPSSTIHSFLKWNKELNKFAVNEYNKSEARIVIIDEASMIDVMLFDSLLRGLTIDTKIILVGDYNQLPSVGPGQLLKDLIESLNSSVISLEYLYRQSKDSNIVSLAYDINKGNIDYDIFNNGEDLVFESSGYSVVDVVKRICNDYKKVNYKNFQVLVPMYKTINGIDNLNLIMQDIFNPKTSHKKEILIGNTMFREGDKVLELVNMPEEKIFNGDIGIIESISTSKKEVVVDFDGNTVKFTAGNFNKFKHGYAISIHKSQGSEFDIVVIPASLGFSKMLYRKLYYTAITRCKKKLFMVGEMDALKRASLNNYSDVRKTTIKEKLIKKLNM